MISNVPVEDGEVIKVTIDTAGPAGVGLAHMEEYVLYVHGGVVGATCRVKIRKAHRTYAEAEVVG